MKKSPRIFLLAAVFMLLACVRPLLAVEGTLTTVTNAHATEASGEIRYLRDDKTKPIEISFAHSQAIGVHRERNAWWVLPLATATNGITANTRIWVLPASSTSADSAWSIVTSGSPLHATQNGDDLTVSLDEDQLTLQRTEARPHCDVLGNRFHFEIESGATLENALAGFYWGTMLPSVVESTLAAAFPYSSGYVLSTLETSMYAGSYPAVDHEFQILGRLAIASPFELDLVQRMLELQFKLMDDDPERLSRMPTSVQPDGRREYHIRRDSENKHENAAMFPVTGNIEVIEETLLWFKATRNRAWLAAHIANLERSADWVLANTDQYGRVWSDVYYEDQVIKDGRVTQAQAFAAGAFLQLAHMEQLLRRTAQAERYRQLSAKMSRVLIEPFPQGFWDESQKRFIDWVDRNGKPHDHVHLLANTLPLTFGYATHAQRAAVQQLVNDNDAEFERFPSFLSAHIDAYTPSEIGIAGPYDLSAAGRYWYWDAAYRAAQNQNALLLQQLNAVAAEAAKDNGFMGERYDMDHVYYVDGKNAHGAGKYYEYPNVFAAVLLSKYLGITAGDETDISLAPHLVGYGTVELQTPQYALRYRWDATGFTLTNLASKSRTFAVDLSALNAPDLRLKSPPSSSIRKAKHFMLTLAPNQQVTWSSH